MEPGAAAGRRCGVLPVLLLLAAAPAVEALPVVGRLDAPGGTRVVLRGTLSPGRAAGLTALAGAVQRDVARRFLSGASHDELPPVDVCLFESAASYEAFVTKVLDGAPAPSALGFFDPRLRLVVANVGPPGRSRGASSVGNLRHELAHALLHDDFPGIPSWLTEGVGSLYGTAVLEKSGRFRFAVNYRLRHLRAAKAAGAVPDLAALAGATAEQVYGDDVLTWYALARYLLLYLDERGTLRACFDELRRAQTAAARRRALEAHVDFQDFLAWSDTLRLGKP